MFPDCINWRNSSATLTWSKWKVIAVGDGKILENGSRAPVDVKVDDIVYFTKYAPDEIEVDGKQYLIIKHSSVLVKQG